MSEITQELTQKQILQRLEEIEINFKSHFGDENYDLSDLITEQEVLETALYNGDYLDAPEE